MARYQPHDSAQWLSAEPLEPTALDAEESESAYIEYQGCIGCMVMGHQEKVLGAVAQLNALFEEGAYPEDDELIEQMRALRHAEYDPIAASVEQLTVEQGAEQETRFLCSACSESLDQPDVDGHIVDRRISIEGSEATGSTCPGCKRIFGGVVLNPKPEMVHQRLEINGWEIDIWQRASSAQSVSQDQALACGLGGGGVRMAVIDGVTPHSSTPGHQRVNGAVYAATAIRQQLRGEQPLDQAMKEANTRLQQQFADGQLMSRALPQATAAGIDLRPDGSAHIVHAGTDSVIVRQGGQLSQIYGGDPVNPEAKKRLDQEKERNPDMTLYEKLAAEERLWTQDQWQSTSLGRFPEATIEQTDLQGHPEEIILASDGALLTEISRAEDIETWVGGLRDFEDLQQAHNADKKYDDVTVIRARPVRSRQNGQA